MPKSQQRQYRAFSPLGITAEQKRLDSNFYTEGYATTWQRYVLYEDLEGPVYEQFTKDAFIGTDMADVIMQYDHQGRVFARISNKTLIVEPDDNGLFVAADLSKSENAKGLYEEISNGLITKMSWGFAPGEYYFDKASRTIIHTKVKKIYDVSAVSIPANDTTDIHARSFVDGEINKMMQELQERKNIELRLRLKLKLGGF